MSKIASVYIVYDLDTWPRNPTNNFKFKNCLSEATKEKCGYYSGYRITFDSAVSWSFDNHFAQNVIIFDADNSSSSHSENWKNKFLIFCLILHYNADNSYLLLNEKEIFKFNAGNKNVTFATQLCFGSISNGFSATELQSLEKYL